MWTLKTISTTKGNMRYMFHLLKHGHVILNMRERERAIMTMAEVIQAAVPNTRIMFPKMQSMQIKGDNCKLHTAERRTRA